MPFYKRASEAVGDVGVRWHVSGRLQVHEGPRVDSSSTGDRGKVGITDYAQQQLGDVVYSSCRMSARKLKQGQSFGTIESVKAVSELYAPVTGEVVEVNAALKDKPEAVNTDPHGSWMIVIKLTDPAKPARCSTPRSTRIW